MEIRRQYQLRDVNWLLFPDLLRKYIASIPEDNLKENNNLLLPTLQFEISTFSQDVKMESHEEFIEFIKTSSEPPLDVEVRIACFYKPSFIDAYEIQPSFLRFVRRREEIFIGLARIPNQAALTFLEEFEGIIQLQPAKPKPEAKADGSERELSRTVFIAHSFDDWGRSYAFQLTKFLSLLGFEVATGEGFSPERVSSKVKRRLMSQEVVIVVLSEKQDMTWLIQEMTGADFAQKPIILLVEEGVEFKAGVLGDLEYIRFEKGRVADCFTPILEGFRELGFSFS
jgi:hypothetical protein